jgi:hypothetical protein
VLTLLPARVQFKDQMNKQMGMHDGIYEVLKRIGDFVKDGNTLPRWVKRTDSSSLDPDLSADPPPLDWSQQLAERKPRGGDRWEQRAQPRRGTRWRRWWWRRPWRASSGREEQPVVFVPVRLAGVAMAHGCSVRRGRRSNAFPLAHYLQDQEIIVDIAGTDQPEDEYLADRKRKAVCAARDVHSPMINVLTSVTLPVV